MIYVHLSITIITLSLALYLYSKASQNNISTLIRWIWYAAIASALAIMVCQLTTGIGRMFGKCSTTECGSNCSTGAAYMNCHKGGNMHMMMGRGSSNCMMMGHGSRNCMMMGKGASSCMHKGKSMKGMKHKCTGKDCKMCKKNSKDCSMMKDGKKCKIEEKVTVDETDDGEKVIRKEVTITSDEEDEG
jgi:hypothetical protein